MPLEIKYNNSAGRLLAILLAIRSALTAENANHPLLTIYPQVFPGSSGKPAAKSANVNESTLELYLELNHLIDAVLKDTLELCEQNEDYKLFCQALVPIDQLRIRFSPSAQIKPVTDILTESVEMALFTFAQALPTTPDIDVNELESIRESIDSLMTEIEKSDIPRTLRVFLFNMERASRDMLDRYRITGSRGLREQFHKILGEMADVYRQDDEKAAGRSALWERIKQIIFSMDKVVAAAHKYPALVDKSGAAFDAIKNMIQ